MYASADLDAARKLIAFARTVESRKQARPFECYEPSYPGRVREDGEVCGPFANQLAYHKSRHKVRLLVPGNGWGKTTAMGAEAHAWATHCNRWQETPAWPVLQLWFCKLESQFDLIRIQLQETVFGDEATFIDREFRWRDGSKLILGLADRSQDWMKWQGVPVDQVFFDEEPPAALWREMAVRSRGRRKTRFTIGATATSGESWMEKELYRPWLEHHKKLGLDERRALIEQKHPRYFVWSMGGLADNPAADQSDVEWYESRTWRSDAERHVRMHGGFRRFTGDPVFDTAALEKMLAASIEGRLAGLAVAR